MIEMQISTIIGFILQIVQKKHKQDQCFACTRQDKSFGPFIYICIDLMHDLNISPPYFYYIIVRSKYDVIKLSETSRLK